MKEGGSRGQPQAGSEVSPDDSSSSTSRVETGLQARLGALVEKCNRCGFCQAGCPTYKATGIEWQVARGRVALVRDILEGRIDLQEQEIGDALGSCLRCGGCTVHCPPQVPTADIVEMAIEELVRRKGEPWVQRVIFRNLLANPGALSAVSKGVRFGQVSGAQSLARSLGVTQLLGRDVHRAQDSLSSIPVRTARELLPSLIRSVPKRRYRVAYFIGCATNLLYPRFAVAAINVLYANATEVLVPDVVVCCGKPPSFYGDLDAARRLARTNVDGLADLDVDAIVTDCATCGDYLKGYGKLLEGDEQYAERAALVSNRMKDISEFLTAIEFNDRLGQVKARVTYHDPCHLGRSQKLTAQPRKLLRSVPGVELVESAEADMCCGGAGSYGLTHYDLSQKVLDRKMANVGKTGADYLATGCPACTMQLASGVRKRGLPMQLIHTVELLDKAYSF